jgi:hypothetical protein
MRRAIFMTEHPMTIQELATWLLNSPSGEARAFAFRSDGNEVVTMKKFINGTIVNTNELSNKSVRQLFGITKGRTTHGNETETSTEGV